MFGLSVSRKKSSRNAFNVKPGEVPGFAKWIANEVYVENRLVESTLEQLTLSMLENVEWINETMDDVLNMKATDDNTSLSEEYEAQDQRTDEDNDNDFNVADIGLNKPENAVKEVSTEDLSTLLLKSPSKIRKRSSASLQRIHSRELNLVTATTNLVLDSAKVGTSTNTADEAKLDSSPKVLNDSFEAISRQIRKSFVKKAQINGSESPHSNTITRETEPTDLNIVVQGADDTLHKDFIKRLTSESENEVAEISKLIDTKQDDSELSAFEEDLSIDVSPLGRRDPTELKKSEMSGTAMKSTSKSPIKFHEMPIRKPIVLDSSRKSIRKSVVNSTTKTNKRLSSKFVANNDINMFETPKPIAKPKKPTEEESVFVDKTGAKADKHNFKLNLPPGRFVSSNGDTSQDEPTIKLNRGVRKSNVLAVSKSQLNQETKTPVQTKLEEAFTRSAPHVSIPPLSSPIKASPSTTKTDLLSRLMRPTESSLKRQRESPVMKERKLVKQDLDIEESPTTVLVPLKGLSPVSKPSIRAKSLGFLSNSGLSPNVKKNIPLTMKPLKTTEDTHELLRKSNASLASVGSPPRKLLMHSMNKVGVNVGTINKTQANLRTTVSLKRNKIPRLERQRLKSITDPVVNSGTNNTSITSEMKASKQENVRSPILNPEDLPDIESGAEEEDAVCLAEWGNRESLRKQLKLQAKTNPIKVFGSLTNVDCSVIFGKRYSGLMNINWQDGDSLGERELASYERAMGWTT